MATRLHRHVISGDVDRALEAWAVAALRGGAPPFPVTPDISCEQWLHFLEFHGIVGLVHARLRLAPAGSLPDPEWADRLSIAARLQAARELLLRQELGHLLVAARARGIQPLVLKGGALAYLVYDEPALRGRVDTDLLVDPADKDAMTRLLEEMGYRGDIIAAEHWATSERTFAKTVADVPVRVDLHWRINNSPLFWHRELEYAQLMNESQPVTALHVDARCPSVPALLAHACLHWASHASAPMYLNGAAFIVPRLNWLYDIDLLARAMTTGAWQRFVALVRAASLVNIARSAIDATADRFATEVPLTVIDQLQPSGREAACDRLVSGALMMKVNELRALPSNAARLGWLREHLLPRRAYMRWRYPLNPRSPLALLYLRRLLPARRTSSTS